MHSFKKGLLSAVAATTIGLGGLLVATPAFASAGDSQGTCARNSQGACARHGNGNHHPSNASNASNGNGNGNGGQCNSNANRNSDGNGNFGSNANSNASDNGWRENCIEEASRSLGTTAAPRGVASNTGDVNGLAGGIALGLAGAAAATGALVRIRLR